MPGGNDARLAWQNFILKKGNKQTWVAVFKDPWVPALLAHLVICWKYVMLMCVTTTSAHRGGVREKQENKKQENRWLGCPKSSTEVNPRKCNDYPNKTVELKYIQMRIFSDGCPVLLIFYVIWKKSFWPHWTERQ